MGADFVLAVLQAPPPPPGTAEVALGAWARAWESGISSKVLAVWPAVVPFVILRFAFGLVDWWLDARARRKQPEQLSLF